MFNVVKLHIQMFPIKYFLTSNIDKVYKLFQKGRNRMMKRYVLYQLYFNVKMRCSFCNHQFIYTQEYLQNIIKVRRHDVPFATHIFLGTCVSYYIIHEMFVGKCQWARIDAPYVSFGVHQTDGQICIFLVHAVHHVNASLFKNSEIIVF